MKDIKEFRINPDLDSLNNVKKIVDSVNNFVSNEHIQDLSANLSNILEIPTEITNKKLKQIIYNQFNYYDNEPKFKIDFKLFRSIKYFFLFMLIILFKKKIKVKNNKREKMDIILDNVEKQYVVEKFGKILSHYRKSLILTNSFFANKFNLNNETIALNVHKSFLSCNILQGKTFNCLKFVLNLFIFSKKNKLDLMKIFFLVFYISLKYYKIFSYYDSKYLIHDRIYHSCAIRNYLFKKNGGKKTICLQSHLPEAAISVFCDIDILLKFGKENFTEKKLEALGGKINISSSVGSIRMEQSLVNTDLLKKIKPIDILILGVNISMWGSTSKDMKQNYYEQIRWIAKISKKFPNLRILIKHHENFRGDTTEDELLKDTGIEKVIKPTNGLNSYHYLMKSNFIISFCSTMILEALSMNKKSFFFRSRK